MAQGPEVSRHGRDWSFWNSSLGLWSALGRKLQDNPVLPTEVSGETFLVVFFFLSLIPFLAVFLPVTLDYSQHR